MRGAGQKNVTGKTAKWESELWSYLSSGDGINCPLHDNCKLKQNGGLCLDDQKDKLGRLYGGATLSVDFDSERIDDFSKVVGHDFLENWKPGPIFQLVERLANKYLEQSNITQPPVPAQIIDTFDIDRPVEIRPVSLKAYQGAVWYTDGSWVVHLNNQEPPVSQRVTLFHEIFHIIAHTKSTPVFRQRGIREGFFNELLADYFAGCILTPRKLVAEKWAEVNELKRMTEIFQVTELAMWFRLKTMRLL